MRVDPDVAAVVAGGRYSRQILATLRGTKLDQASIGLGRVALIGAGTLGSNYAVAAAATGVGSIDIFDFDIVGDETLGRSVAFLPSDVGLYKAAALATRVRELNPKVASAACIANALHVGQGTWEAYDVIVLATDDGRTRRELVSLALRLPKGPSLVLEAGITGFDWSVQAMAPGTHCYNCTLDDDVSFDVTRSCNGIHLDAVGAVMPTTLPAALSAVGILVQETLLALSGARPVFLGHEVRASMATPSLAVIRIPPRPSCRGHDRLSEANVIRLSCDSTLTLSDVRRQCAELVECEPSEVTLCAPRRLISRVQCLACRTEIAFKGYADALLAAACRKCEEPVESTRGCVCGEKSPPRPQKPLQRLECPRCGQLDPNGFEVASSTILEGGLPLRESGIPTNEVLSAHWFGGDLFVIIQEETWMRQ